MVADQKTIEGKNNKRRAALPLLTDFKLMQQALYRRYSPQNASVANNVMAREIELPTRAYNPVTTLKTKLVFVPIPLRHHCPVARNVSAYWVP